MNDNVVDIAKRRRPAAEQEPMTAVELLQFIIDDIKAGNMPEPEIAVVVVREPNGDVVVHDNGSDQISIVGMLTIATHLAAGE